MEEKGKVIGLGGVFYRFENPAKMRLWYQQVLGITTNDYGVLFEFNNGENSLGYLQLGTFDKSSDYFEKSQSCMLNFRVDDMNALIKKLNENNVKILNEVAEYEYGKFLHIQDPEGNRIELWEPVDRVFQSDSSPKMPMK